jgi:hypothetical protein
MPLALAFALSFRLALAALVITALCWAQTARAEKRVALVIGNDRYLNMPADKRSPPP